MRMAATAERLSGAWLCGPRRIASFQAVGDFRFCDGKPDGRAVPHAFCTRDDVWHNVPVLDSEPFGTCAAPACLHFITDEEASRATDDLLDNGEVLFRRRDKSANALY